MRLGVNSPPWGTSFGKRSRKSHRARLNRPSGTIEAEPLPFKVPIECKSLIHISAPHDQKTDLIHEAQISSAGLRELVDSISVKSFIDPHHFEFFGALRKPEGGGKAQ